MTRVRQPRKSLPTQARPRPPRLTIFQRELQRHMKRDAQQAAWMDNLVSLNSPSKLDH